MRIVLIHGAATTGRIWNSVAAHLQGWEVVAPDRPCSGDLDSELDFLAPLCDGAIVGGVSGGATLGLALATRGVPFRTAVLHEPAAGSLVPDLLETVAAAYRIGGVPGFGTTLYGATWSIADAPADPDAVRRDLAMFRRFEPAAAVNPEVLLTVGGQSPPVRQQVQHELTSRLGLPGFSIPGAGHAVHLQLPAAFAGLLSRSRAPEGW